MGTAFLRNATNMKLTYCIILINFFILFISFMKTCFQENYREQIASGYWIPNSAILQKFNVVVVSMAFFMYLVLLVMRNFTVIPAVKTFAFQNLAKIFFCFLFLIDTCTYCSLTLFSWWVHMYLHNQEAKLISW